MIFSGLLLFLVFGAAPLIYLYLIYTKKLGPIATLFIVYQILLIGGWAINIASQANGLDSYRYYFALFVFIVNAISLALLINYLRSSVGWALAFFEITIALISIYVAFYGFSQDDFVATFLAFSGAVFLLADGMARFRSQDHR